MLFMSCVCYAFVRVGLLMPCSSLLGNGSWLSFVMSNCELALSHWYPGTGLVLHCIDF